MFLLCLSGLIMANSDVGGAGADNLFSQVSMMERFVVQWVQGHCTWELVTFYPVNLMTKIMLGVSSDVFRYLVDNEIR